MNKVKEKKFGTFKGVFVPSTEAILGTVLFLLLPTLVTRAGLIPMLIIVILAHTVTIATAFSIADCATNLNTIGGGGMYAISRKSLGKAFGGSIGIMLYLAQAASISFYCIGFAEPLQQLFQEFFNNIGLFPVIVNSSETAINILRQKQVIAGIMFFVFFIIVMIGADFTLKLQMLILFILILSVVMIFISPFLGIKFDGNYIFQSFKKINLFHGSIPADIPAASLFVVFTTFFPAVTGVDAGVGMSGDLQKPKKSLVSGTFLAIGVTFIIYMVSTIIFSAISPQFGVRLDDFGGLTGLFGINKSFPGNIAGIIIMLGILFATSSSALSCFMTAPRTVQSLSKDGILPKFLNILRHDFKKGGKEPRYATFLTFILAIVVILIGEIETAANIVGICFLVVYGWVNGSAFLERISRNPTFRPSIKNHWIVSLYGFIASMIAICLFNINIGILIIFSQMLLFWLILKFKSESKLEGVWWGVVFSFVTKGLKSLKSIVQGAKNWRPILISVAYQNEIIPIEITTEVFEKRIFHNLTDDKHKIFITDCYRKSEDQKKYELKKDLSIDEKKEILLMFKKLSYSKYESTANLSELIASYQGLVTLNVITPDKIENLDLTDYYPEKDIPMSIITANEPTQAVMTMVNMSNPGGIEANSILLEYTKKINLIHIIKNNLELEKNVFIFKNSEKLEKYNHIDIWWRGENNGNLMLLLSYIIHNSSEYKNKTDKYVRVIRILQENETIEQVNGMLSDLLEKSRLTGEILLIPYSEEKLNEQIISVSNEADLILMGIPGNIEESTSGIGKLFKLDEMFFNQEINKYDSMPAILFVKSAFKMNLVEE